MSIFLTAVVCLLLGVYLGACFIRGAAHRAMQKIHESNMQRVLVIGKGVVESSYAFSENLLKDVEHILHQRATPIEKMDRLAIWAENREENLQHQKEIQTKRWQKGE
jgi:hypothetical protein